MGWQFRPPHQRKLVEVIGKTNYLLPKGMPRSQAHLFKNDGQGAKSCKGRLEEIKTDKSCKEEPVRTVNHGKDYAEKNKTAAKS